MEPLEAVYARPQRRRRRSSSTANRDSKRVAIRAHKANKPAPSPQPKDRVDSLSPCDQQPTELRLPPPLHQLTKSNLRAHTRQTNPEMTASSPSKIASDSSATKTIYDREADLRLFGAKLDSNETPREIEDLVKWVTSKEPDGPSSPRAQNLHNNAAWAKLQNETDLGIKLNLDLMAAPADLQGGEKYVKLTAEANFNPLYVTRPRHPEKPDDPYVLTQPRPDYTNGYLTRADAQAVKRENIERPFTEEQERKLLSNTCPALHRNVHCPWLTIQYKAFGVKHATLASQLQCCRDGIAVNQYMTKLFQCAGPGFKFSIVDTCHWSLSCDGETVQLYIHYRSEKNGAVEFHMRTVSQDFLRGAMGEDVNQGIVRLRRRLRNILHHAQNARLDRIKEVLEYIEAPAENSPKKPTQSILKSVQTSSGIGSAPSVVTKPPNLAPPNSKSPFDGSPRKKPNAFTTKLPRPPLKPSGRTLQDQGRPRMQPQQQAQAKTLAPGPQALAPVARAAGPPGPPRSSQTTPSQQLAGPPASLSASAPAPITTRIGRPVVRPERYRNGS